MAGQVKYDESTHTKYKVKEPRMYQKSETEAFQLMYAIHRGVKAIVGTYVYDIAITKVEESVKRAREAGYPFRVEAEPVGK